MAKNDQVIFEYAQSRFMQVAKPRLPNNANFLIVCEYGDWSGFLTFDEAVARIAEMETSTQRRDGFFQVVER